MLNTWQKNTGFTDEKHEADDDPLPPHPCVRPKRLRVYETFPVYTGTTCTCVSISARGAGIHGDFLNVHTGTFWTDTRVFFSVSYTTHQTPHRTTRHNTTQHDTPQDTTTRRPQHHTETETERDRDRQRERDHKTPQQDTTPHGDRDRERQRQRQRKKERKRRRQNKTKREDKRIQDKTKKEERREKREETRRKR